MIFTALVVVLTQVEMVNLHEFLLYWPSLFTVFTVLALQMCDIHCTGRRTL